MAYYDFLNIVLSPLFRLPVLAAVLLMSLLISIIIILITKYTTDQALMKKLKEDMKEYQKQIKGYKNDTTKAMEVQKKLMESNMKYMMHSLRPTLITFIPIILIFGWMSANFAYQSIQPQQEFQVTAIFDKNIQGNAQIILPPEIKIVGDSLKKIDNGKAAWILKGSEGEHLIEINHDGEKQQTSVMISTGRKYINQVKKTQGSIKSIEISYPKLIVLPVGYRNWFGWLGTYILSSIIFTMILRKILKVY